MENVRIAVLDIGNHAVAFMDNRVPKALHFYNDELHTYLKGAACTFEFSVAAKHEDAQYLTVGNHLAFKYKDRDYYFNIMSADEDENTVTVESYALLFELLEEEKDAYTASKAMTFVEYMKVFDGPGAVKIGINEISTYSRRLTWESSDNMLSRLYSLATNFDAEVEFVPKLNNDYSLKQITMNVYKEHSDTTQGIGQDRSGEIIRYGKGINGVERKMDITELCTAIRPYGTDNITISGLSKKEYDKDGNLEYQTSGTNILAVQAKGRFPSMLTDYTTDRYAVKIWSYDTKDKNTLYSKALAKLKTLCVPKAEYTVEGYVDTQIGDTVTIEDTAFHPTLYLKARVTEQVISLTNKKNNKTTFDNFSELKSEVSETTTKQIEKLMDASKPYQCSVVSSDGTMFKNGEGTTALTAKVIDGGKDITDNLKITWLKEGTKISEEKSVTVKASDVSGTATYVLEARDQGDMLRGTCEVTISNVNDGSDGEAGAQGPQGEKGETGAQGPQGEKGDAGEDGVSPTVDIAKSGGITTISITDKDGKHTETIEDGTDGSPGKDAILISETEPETPKIGQLWQMATGEPIKRWNGSSWVIHYISVENLDAQTLSAICADLGTVIAGIIQNKSGRFVMDITNGSIESYGSSIAGYGVTIDEGILKFINVVNNVIVTLNAFMGLTMTDDNTASGMSLIPYNNRWWIGSSHPTDANSDAVPIKETLDKVASKANREWTLLKNQTPAGNSTITVDVCSSLFEI